MKEFILTPASVRNSWICVTASGSCRTYRAGHYERGLQTKAGEVRLRVPKLRRETFETAIIERYRRRESSVEEALIEMYLAGVSVRRVEDITEAL
jgi:transposase-like protein